MRLESSENSLQGRWLFVEGEIVKDDVCQRIDDLIKNYLNTVKSDQSGWHVLYQDPSDGRYWELSYPETEMHGGGPPRLAVLGSVEAKIKYGLS
jgi:hypothetical protein